MRLHPTFSLLNPGRWLVGGALWAVLTGAGPAPATSPEASKETPPASPAAAPKPARRPPIAFLPDSAVLAQVGNRPIRARQFVEAYFGAAQEYRPRGDSAGRAQFLETLIDKEVFASAARALKRPESFEDRGMLRATTEEALVSTLFQRVVLDSVQVSEADAQALYQQMKRVLRIERLRFGTRQTAERVRAEVAANRMSWSRAAELRLRMPGDTTSTDLGWLKRADVAPEIARKVFGVPVGGVSEVIVDAPRYAIYRVVDERALPLRPYSFYSGAIQSELRDRDMTERRERLLSGMRAAIELRVDSLNVAWAATLFPVKVRGGGTSNVTVDVSVPVVAPEDTGRVLATYRGGRVTMGDLVDSYRGTPDLQRPSLDSQEAIRVQLDAMLLKPQMADAARRRGLDRDPLARGMIERRREEILVDHLYQDSILSRVFVPPDARRKYYQENEREFTTAPLARYALFYFEGPVTKDTMVARLSRGMPAAELIRADSAKGFTRGQIGTLRQDEVGHPFHNQLFDSLRVGQLYVVGPDEGDGYNVLQLIEREPGKKIPFDEADAKIDERLQQEAADRLLAAWIERHRRRMKVVSRPELVMRVRLVDPTAR